MTADCSSPPGSGRKTKRGATPYAQDLGCHTRAGHIGADGFAVDQEERLQAHAGTDLVTGAVDLEDVADSDLVLAAATAHDRVHA